MRNAINKPNPKEREREERHTMRKYGLFQRKRNAPKTTRWEQVPGTTCYGLMAARTIFQDRLIASAFNPDVELSLRPISSKALPVKPVGVTPVRTWPSSMDDDQTCDHCPAPLKDEPYFVDGIDTISGRWGFMCSTCFCKIGVGLGTGRGQRWRHPHQTEEAANAAR